MLKKFIFSISALLLTSPASAALVRVDFTGRVYQTSGAAADRFDLGAPVTGSVEFESADQGEPWYPGGVLDSAFRYYPSAPVGGFLEIQGYYVAFGSAARMFVSDNEIINSGLIDRIIFDDYGAAASPIFGIPFYTTFLNWQNFGGGAISGLNLPLDQTTFDRFESKAGVIDWGYSNSDSNRVTFNFDNVITSAVPDVSTWVSLVLGMYVMALFIRRGYASQAQFFKDS